MNTRRRFLRNGLWVPAIFAIVKPSLAQVMSLRDPGFVSGLGRKPAAAGGGGGTNYYPYAYTVSDFASGGNFGTDYSLGSPIVVTTGGTATKLGVKMADAGTPLDVRLCLYTGTSTPGALAGVTVQSPGSGTYTWVEGSISYTVTSATTYHVLAHISNAAVNIGRQAVVSTNYGRYINLAYSAGNCVSAERATEVDYVYGVRITV